MMKKIFVALLSMTLLLVVLNLFFIIEKETRDAPTPVPGQSTSRASQAVRATQDAPPNSWSDMHLWDSFHKTESYALFAARTHEALPVFYFKISGTLREAGRSVHFVPTSIAIADSKRMSLLQTLTAKNRFDNDGRGWNGHDGNLVQLIDVNFDGFLDLRVLNKSTATGNARYATYVYNPTSQKFIYHERLAALSGVTLDADQHQILTSWKGGPCSECREHFAIAKDNALLLTRAEWTRRESTGAERYCQWYTGVPTHRQIPNLCVSYSKGDYDKFLAFARTKGVTIVKNTM